MMNCRLVTNSLVALLAISIAHAHEPGHYHAFPDEIPIVDYQASASEDTIPAASRTYWMRRAIQALADIKTPCPYQAFGAVIVNHTSSAAGDLVCIGANDIGGTGNPTLHGEIAAINNCSAVLMDPEGSYRLSPEAVLSAWQDLSLYTTAEPCPMCATAIRWGGFNECIFGTSSETLTRLGWDQIPISAQKIFDESRALSSRTRLIGNVLANETDVLFQWQRDEDARCPDGCRRSADGDVCAPP